MIALQSLRSGYLLTGNDPSGHGLLGCTDEPPQHECQSMPSGTPVMSPIVGISMKSLLNTFEKTARPVALKIAGRDIVT